MSKPSVSDMETSLEDARFFCEKLNAIIRGPEEQHDLEIIRRYFRAYLHCWKCILHFIRDAKGLKGKKNEPDWIAWCKKSAKDNESFNCLRCTRDHDTHVGTIEVNGEVALGIFPIVMFKPEKDSGPHRELISCCESGLNIAENLIREHASA